MIKGKVKNSITEDDIEQASCKYFLQVQVTVGQQARSYMEVFNPPKQGALYD